MPTYRVQTKAGNSYDLDLADGDDIESAIAEIEASEVAPAPVVAKTAAPQPAPADEVPLYDIATGAQIGVDSAPISNKAEAQAKKDAWVSKETARLEPINPGKSKDTLRALAESRYSPDTVVAPAVDRVKQYKDRVKNPNVGDAGALDAAQFDQKLQAKTNKKFQTAKPDERGDRIGTTYNPNTARERTDQQNQDIITAKEDAAMRARGESMSPMMRGLAKGALQTKGFAAGAVAFAGDLVGEERVRQWGLEAYNTTMHQIGNMPAKEFTGLETADDVATYLGETLSYGAFQAAQAILTGGVGGMVGKQMGKEAVGQVVALAASNVATELGMIYGDAQEEAARTGKPPPSLAQVAAGAVVAAAIDTFADKIGMDAVTRAGFKGNALARVSKSVGMQMGVQGGTEVLQKVPEELGAGKDPFREGILKDYINEGAAGAIMGGGPGVAGAIRRNTPANEIAGEIDAAVNETTFTDADAEVRRSMSPYQNADNVRQVGEPSTISFTSDDSPTAQAGLVPIVVPNMPAPTGEQDVSTDSAPGPLAPVGGGAASSDAGGSLDGAGLPPVGAGGMDQPAAGIESGNGAPALPGAAAAEQLATVGLPRVAERDTDADLMSRVESAIAPATTMMGRSGKGYATEADAKVAQQVGTKREPDMDWKIEPTEGGRFRVAAYKPLEDNGTKPASWVIKNKETGAIVLETFDEKKVAALNTEKYEAVPIIKHLSSLSTPPDAPASAYNETSENQRQETGNGQDAGAAGAGMAGAAQPDSSAGTENPSSVGRALPMAPDAGGGLQPVAGATEVSGSQVARPADLKIALPAPAPIAAKTLRSLEKQGFGAAETATPTTDAQYAASALGRVLGRTVTFIKPTAAGASPVPNAFIIGGESRHIYVATDAEDAPVKLVFHEAVHTLPDAIKRTLVRQLGKTFDQTKRAEFSKEFRYSESDANFDEEIAAFITQAVSGRADFLTQFKAKLKDNEFRGAIQVLLDNLKSIITKVQASDAYGDAFIKKYVTDVQKAIDIVSTAMAGQANAQADQVSAIPEFKPKPAMQRSPSARAEQVAVPDAVEDSKPVKSNRTADPEAPAIPPAFWRKFKVPHEVYIVDEDVYETIDVPANQALASVNEDIENLRALLDCMKG